MTALFVDDVTKVYGEGHTAVRALCNASISLQDNEFLALVGPSGSGKTTLLSVIGGLLAPTSGSVVIGDTTLSDLSRKEQTRFRANRVGFVFQGFNLVPFLTARENMTVMASISDSSRNDIAERADQLLEELGLSDRSDNLPEQLSGGERQRVAMARALLNRPQVLLADEPTGNLDPDSAGVLLDLLAAQVESGVTILLVTHEEHAAKYAQRTILLRQGRLDQPASA